MRTMREWMTDFHDTGDLHSLRHCRDSLTKDLAEVDDLIAKIKVPPMSEHDHELANTFEADRRVLVDLIALAEPRLNPEATAHGTG